MLVLDASFAVPMFVADPRSERALTTIERLRREGHTFVAPTLWTYEVVSSLQKLRHFKQITSTEVESAIQLMTDFEIELVHPDRLLIERALTWSEQLRRASAYDSFYLALAENRSCDLWTADNNLFNAVQRNWVRLLDSK